MFYPQASTIRRAAKAKKPATLSRPIWGFLIEVFSVSLYAELRTGGSFARKPLAVTRGKGFTELDFFGGFIVTASNRPKRGFTAPLRAD